jgi:hypothetical protein
MAENAMWIKPRYEPGGCLGGNAGIRDGEPRRTGFTLSNLNCSRTAVEIIYR